jgi:hypothetical protein
MICGSQLNLPWSERNLMGHSVGSPLGPRSSSVSTTRQQKGRHSWKPKIKLEKSINIKNAVFWDIKTQFVLHRRHLTSLLLSPAS